MVSEGDCDDIISRDICSRDCNQRNMHGIKAAVILAPQFVSTLHFGDSCRLLGSHLVPVT